MRDLEAIKASIDLREYIALDLGAPEKRSRGQYFWTCPLPNHKENTASFMAESDHYHCFGCKESGSVFDYVMNTRGLNFKEAVDYVDGQDRKPFVRTEKPKTEKPRIIYSLSEMAPYEKRLPIVEPYLDQRRITKAAAVENHVGAAKASWHYQFHNGDILNTTFNRVSVPTVYCDKVLALNFRRDELSVQNWIEMDGNNAIERVKQDLEYKSSLKNKTKIITLQDAIDELFGPRYIKPADTRDSIWGCNHLAYEIDGVRYYRRISYAIVVESTFDGLTGHSAGYLHIACKPSSRFDFRRIFQNVSTVYILRQNDQTGFKYASDMYDLFGADKSKVRVMSLPKEFKDENDLARAGELENFLSGYPYYLKPNLF